MMKREYGGTFMTFSPFLIALVFMSSEITYMCHFAHSVKFN